MAQYLQRSEFHGTINDELHHSLPGFICNHMQVEIMTSCILLYNSVAEMKSKYREQQKLWFNARHGWKTAVLDRQNIL